MPDTSALELEAREISPTQTTRLIDHALKLFSGALFTAALVAGGAVLVIAALTLGVVGAPVIFAALVALSYAESKRSKRMVKTARPCVAERSSVA
jgi:hypothetical protein